MSQRPNDQPRDWRRRRRGSSPSAAGSDASPEVSAEIPAASGAETRSDPRDESTEEIREIITSRTLFSFMEPTLNVIGSYSKPVVIAGVVALFLGSGLTTFVESMRLYGIILIVFGAVLVGFIGLIFLSAVFAAFISRTGRYGVNTLIMLAAFIAIVLIVNFISFANHSRIDTTFTNQFSLDSDTKNLLDNLKEPVRAIAFYREDISERDELVRRGKVEGKLQEFRNRTSNFSYEFIDPEIEPDLARTYGVSQDGYGYESIVVIGTKSGLSDGIQPTDPDYSQLEQDLYTGILVATGQEQRTVYFLAGHRERSLDISTGEGYELASQGLKGDNYRVQTLRWNLAEENVNVPDDAALLVIAGPTAELPEAHAQALNLYLQGLKADGTDRRQGGRMIFLAEPDLPESFRVFMANWGVIIGDRYILDRANSLADNPLTLRVVQYYRDAPREIVFPRETPLGESFMPGTAPLLIVPGGARLPLPLARTSDKSILVDDIETTELTPEDGNRARSFDPAVYVLAIGPVGSPPPASEPPESQISGIVVFGDTDFASNSFFDRGSGRALFLNSANFLLGDFSLVSIRDRKTVFREWNLDRNELKFVRFSSWLFLPGLMGLMAALVWWVRR